MSDTSGLFNKVTNTCWCVTQMNAWRKCCVVLLILASALITCGASIESANTVIQVDTTTPIWRTATNHTVALDVFLPVGVHSAVVTVTAPRFKRVIENVEGEVVLDLPDPSDREKEAVYDLEVVFENGMSRKSRLAVVKGAADCAEAETFCLSDQTALWGQVGKSAVLPINASVLSLEIDGDQVDTGLDGAAGYYQWKPASNGPHMLALTSVSGDRSEVVINKVPNGSLLLVR